MGGEESGEGGGGDEVAKSQVDNAGARWFVFLLLLDTPSSSYFLTARRQRRTTCFHLPSLPLLLVLCLPHLDSPLPVQQLPLSLPHSPRSAAHELLQSTGQVYVPSLYLSSLRVDVLSQYCSQRTGGQNILVPLDGSLLWRLPALSILQALRRRSSEERADTAMRLGGGGGARRICLEDAGREERRS